MAEFDTNFVLGLNDILITAMQATGVVDKGNANYAGKTKKSNALIELMNFIWSEEEVVFGDVETNEIGR